MARIGYLEGVEPEVLDRLALEGHEIVELGDGKDHHGKNLTHITKYDRIDLVVTHFFKLRHPSRLYGAPTSLVEGLKGCKKADVPLVVVVPQQEIGRIRKKLSEEGVEDLARLTIPEQVFPEIVTLLEEKARKPSV